MVSDWALYLLIDPTTGPTSHPDGTVFYVGRHADAWALSRGLDMPVTEDALARGVFIPADETQAREHAQALRQARVAPIVEYVRDDSEWTGAATPAEQERMSRAVAQALHPHPLNRPAVGQHYAHASTDDHTLPPTPALPADAPVHVAYLPSGLDGTTEEILAFTLADLVWLIPERDTRTGVLTQTTPEEPVLVLLVTKKPRGVPAGYVFGAWWATGVNTNDNEPPLHVLDGDEAGAVWRHYRGTIYPESDLR